MSLLDLLPHIQLLERAEKIQLIQLLARDLADAEAPPSLVAGQSYPVWSPDDAFTGAEVLLQTLRTP